MLFYVLRYVIHTVGPRYNVKYKTAAESALYASYRNVMKIVRFVTLIIMIMIMIIIIIIIIIKHRQSAEACNLPDITLVHKDTQKWTLIDIAVPADQNITRTEEDKVEKYQELAFEIRRIHGTSKVTIIPIMIGALGSISKGAKTWFGKLDVPDFLGSVQLLAILGTAHLLWKVLCL